MQSWIIVWSDFPDNGGHLREEFLQLADKDLLSRMVIHPAIEDTESTEK